MGPRELTLLALLAVAWGGSYTLIKVSIDTVPPATIVAARLVIATLLLWGYMALRGERLPSLAGQWRLYWAVAISGNTLPFLLITWGETHIDAGLAAILIGSVPLMTLALAPLLAADEKAGPARLAGIALGFAALVVLVGPSALAGLGGSLFGELALLAAAAAFAVNGLLVRRIGPAITGASTVVLGLSALVALPIALVVDKPWTLSPAPEAWAAMATQGAISTAWATVVFFHLIRTCGATATSTVNYLVPLAGVALGVAVLGERPGITEFVALAMMLGALLLVRGQSDRPKTSAIP